MPSLSDIRKEYAGAALNERDAEKNPFTQFQKWFQQVIDAKVTEPNVMTLASVNENKPSARIVLLKDFDENGFVFFTNYESCKGKEIIQNPNVALVFFWKELDRQVRVMGAAHKISQKDSEEYFHSRPRGSQIGAWASNQSEIIANRDFLEKRFRDLGKKFDGKDVPLPPYWGGFCVVPSKIEFWQGRPDRMHDRLLYTRQPDHSWTLDRLSP
jgi:pyridoxamine 5'-phosphate oxidase